MTATSPWLLPASITCGEPFGVDVPALLCAEGSVLFGGWAMGLAVDAAQTWSGLAARAMSMQFFAPVRDGDRLDLVVTSPRAGRSVTHGEVRATSGGTPVFAAQLTLGIATRSGPLTWPAGPPPAPPPEECAPRSYRSAAPGSASDTLDVRLAAVEPAPGTASAGRSLLWARVLPAASPQAHLAVLSDHVPYLVVRSLAGVRYATSVSAGLRITGALTAGWALLETELAAADADTCVGRVRIWSGASLVAVADQTVYVRTA